MFGFLFIIVVSLTSLPLASAAKKDIQVPFVGKVGERGLLFQLTVGTPPQLIDVSLYHDLDSGVNLELSDLRFNNKGFDPSKSTTFVNVSQSTWDYYETNATESFELNGITLTQKPVNLKHYSLENKDANLGIKRYSYARYKCPEERNGDCTTFVESVVREYPNQVLVIAVDSIKTPQKDGSLVTGHLAFGNKATNLCKKNWVYRAEVENLYAGGYTWTFDLDSLKAGEYTYSYKTQAVISNFSKLLFLPQIIYGKVREALGAKYIPRIPCNSTQTVTLKLGRRQLVLGPEILIDQDTADVDGKCQLQIEVANIYTPYIQIPLTAFNKQCILFDYKNLRLGFADRV